MKVLPMDIISVKMSPNTTLFALLLVIHNSNRVESTEYGLRRGRSLGSSSSRESRQFIAKRLRDSGTIRIFDVSTQCVFDAHKEMDKK